jgi:hypothetical protein
MVVSIHMYTSISDMLTDIGSLKTKEQKIEKIKYYAKAYRYFENFLRWSLFNPKTPVYKKIPEYNPNMVDISLSYIKLEKALSSLKYFFDGPEFVQNSKKRDDKLLCILEEISWLEAPLFESLVLNNFKNYTQVYFTKEEVLEALPEMKDIA